MCIYLILLCYKSRKDCRWLDVRGKDMLTYRHNEKVFFAFPWRFFLYFYYYYYFLKIGKVHINGECDRISTQEGV